jgi:signal transduction histidine kinase
VLPETSKEAAQALGNRLCEELEATGIPYSARVRELHSELSKAEILQSLSDPAPTADVLVVGGGGRNQTSSSALLLSFLEQLGNPMASLIADLDWVTTYLLGSSKPEAAGLERQHLRELFEASEEARSTAERVKQSIALFGRLYGAPSRAVGTTDLRDAVQRAVDMVQVEAARSARIQLELSDTPPVSAHPSQVTQVLLNLVMNACESIPTGQPDGNSITIRTRVENNRAVIEVEDTGSGIADFDLARVFDAFFTTKTKDGKRGLGLAVVKETVQSLGGQIKVSSVEGKGAVFTVTLALA